MTQEIEAKFWVRQPQVLRQRLLALGAASARPRMLERNWRFDDEGGTIGASRGVLRLRQDDKLRLTLKSPGEVAEIRTETEVEVHGLEPMMRLLAGLGYRPFFVYEKYREVFRLEPCEVMLDELPFGFFVEVEGPSLAEVQRTAEALGLAWPRRVGPGYWPLYRGLRQAAGLAANDATFEALAGFDPSRLDAWIAVEDGLAPGAGPRPGGEEVAWTPN